MDEDSFSATYWWEKAATLRKLAAQQEDEATRKMIWETAQKYAEQARRIEAKEQG